MSNSVNPAGYGGGIKNEAAGTVLVTNCTFAGNSAGFGSAIYTFLASLSMRNATISANSNVAVYGDSFVGNCIIAGNGGSQDVFGTFTSGGYNLIGRTNGSSGWGALGDQFGTTASPLNPNLLPLGLYGDTTLTMPPASGSLAIDQGKSFGVLVDQRGRLRPFDNPTIPNATLGDGSDIGAVEVGSSATLLVTTTNDAGAGSLRQVIFDTSSVETDTVAFAANVTNTIRLTNGEIAITKSINIVGPGAKILAVSGNNSRTVGQA